VFSKITPLIITHNEAPNIRRTLDKLKWARRIVLVDSGSTDETIEIAQSYPQVEVLRHRFVDFASQCNYGISQITTPWVLSLDADYELSDELVTELKSLAPFETTAGYQAKFVFRIYGRALRGSLYPARIVLFRSEKASYWKEGHCHRLSIQGDIRPLNAPIFHDDRKLLANWFLSQQRYASEEAEHLLNLNRDARSFRDRIRLAAWPAPIAVFMYTLLVKGCLLDGWRGWYYALQRGLAETLLSLEIIQRRLSRDDDISIRLSSDSAKSFEECGSTHVEGSDRPNPHKIFDRV
jgi:glycosyltransferase involved in cell wall biosynthesis